VLLLYFVAAGVLIGLALRGRLDRLATVRLRWASVAVGGLLFQLVLFSDPVAAVVGGWGPALYVASTLTVLMALLRNVTQPGFVLIGVGAALNLVAIVANGGTMPTPPEAYLSLTGRAELEAGVFSNSVITSAGTRFAVLGDVFVLPRPWPFANVFSIGDVLIGLGATWFIVRSMVRRPSPLPAGPVWVGGRTGRVRTSGSTMSVPQGRGGNR
jgi:hypothetical protein